MKRAATGIPIIAGALTLSACVSSMMVGAETTSTPPPNPQARYQVTACVDNAGRPIAVQGALSYYVERRPEGLSIYEFDALNRGSRISNTWTEGNNTHFYTFIRLAGIGYEYIVPADAREAGVRQVYTQGTFQNREENGVLRPIGNPSARCEMTPL